MDRGAWQATVYGVARVQHNLVTKPPPLPRSRGCISPTSAFPVLLSAHTQGMYDKHLAHPSYDRNNGFPSFELQ